MLHPELCIAFLRVAFLPRVSKRILCAKYITPVPLSHLRDDVADLFSDVCRLLGISKNSERHHWSSPVMRNIRQDGFQSCSNLPKHRTTLLDLTSQSYPPKNLVSTDAHPLTTMALQFTSHSCFALLWFEVKLCHD